MTFVYAKIRLRNFAPGACKMFVVHTYVGKYLEVLVVYKTYITRAHNNIAYNDCTLRLLIILSKQIYFNDHTSQQCDAQQAKKNPNMGEKKIGFKSYSF